MNNNFVTVCLRLRLDYSITVDKLSNVFNKKIKFIFYKNIAHSFNGKQEKLKTVGNILS